jgi:hypothetical protein
LLTQAEDITHKLAGKQAASPVLWKYVDSDGGGEFFLPTRRQNVHSPYSGKSCPQRPEKYQIPAVGKELKEQMNAPAPGAPGPKTSIPKNRRKHADDEILALENHEAGMPMLWEYTDPDGKKFFLEERVHTVRSPFSGKTFPARPERLTPSGVGQELREEMHAPDPSDVAF